LKFAFCAIGPTDSYSLLTYNRYSLERNEGWQDVGCIYGGGGTILGQIELGGYITWVAVP